MKNVIWLLTTIFPLVSLSQATVRLTKEHVNPPYQEIFDVLMTVISTTFFPQVVRAFLLKNRLLHLNYT